MEYFYTFLSPLVFEYAGTRYLCWGYCEVNNEAVCFSATLDENTPWTKATCFNDKQLVEEFKKLLPTKVIKRKRRKRE